MPTTRTGRQSSPSKDHESPSKVRVQPMRGARLRSASPFFDGASTSTSAAVSQQSSHSSSPAKASPSKSPRVSPRKKAAATSASLQPPVRRSTRSRSRSVDPERLYAIEEASTAVTTRVDSEAPDSEAEVARSSVIRLDRASSTHDQEKASPSLASISEESAATPLSKAENGAKTSSASDMLDGYSDSSFDSDSDDSSSSNSDGSSSASSSDDEQEDGSVATLDELLKASQQAYKSRAPAPTTQSQFEDNQDLISFNAGADHARDLQRSGKAMPLVVRAKHQIAKLQGKSGKQPSSFKDKLDEQIQALDQGKLVTDKKKSKHARTVQTSTGSSWFDMPEFGASSSRLAALRKQSAADSGHSKVTGGDARLASAEQLRREVQALRLRNALDPKRFYRASAKNQAMPKFAQLGKIIASPLEPKAVLSRQERGRTVVEELIRDAEAASYAKRKFAESQASHRSNYNGRSKPPTKKKRT
ncbi:uncharacterized protein UMAG_01092 [Mycosarcoma maydis]|uniref:Fcf2 pre-rRNA processing C-terminal domain-containing protein n=1 Tax=Mycosarcoma maydis TaxID=5270 RepID=A0A0D1CXU5_MYCMD|nr:uncharacterized protein UMAG_01092 [Ustilago maydis 521]KIS71183.1 hypothetical protein UMAG_01092 [Ustilago maydis 521]|eukprot:XP_011387052.1 hypothetical protein UMAG_01092 [Ustilago maydis 521]